MIRGRVRSYKESFHTKAPRIPLNARSGQIREVCCGLMYMVWKKKPWFNFNMVNDTWGLPVGEERTVVFCHRQNLSPLSKNPGRWFRSPNGGLKKSADKLKHGMTRKSTCQFLLTCRRVNSFIRQPSTISAVSSMNMISPMTGRNWNLLRVPWWKMNIWDCNVWID